MMDNQSEHKNKFVGYEYKEVKARSDKVSQQIDAYHSFGWEVDENQVILQQNMGITSLKFKRNRKIMNKAELTRLERNYEDCMHQIEVLEKSITQKASAMAITIGVIGTCFMAGSVFAVTATPPIIWLCVLLGIPGIIGWILPIIIYKREVRKRKSSVEDMVEVIHDEIYEICEKGSLLL